MRNIGLNSRVIAPIIAIIGAMMTNSCNSSSHSKIENYNSFPKTIKLVGKCLDLNEGEPTITGAVEQIDSNRTLFYTFKSDTFLMAVDSTNSKIQKLIRKGNGPNEFSCISGMFGKKLYGSEYVSVYDPNTSKLYAINPLRDDSIRLYHEFSKSFRKYTPQNVIQINDNTYVAARGDWEYGLISYNSDNGKIIEWPAGISHENSSVSYEDELSLRYLAYNSYNKIIAEIYGCNPNVILHNENGEIINIFKYTGYEPKKNSYDVTSDCFRRVSLTDNHILLLYGDPYDGKDSHIFVIDYSGTPVVDFIIESAYDFTFNEKNNEIIAVNPDSEDCQIMCYKLPDNIKL